MILSEKDFEISDSILEGKNSGLIEWEGYSDRSDFINVFEASLAKENKKNTSNSSLKTKENSLNQEIKYKFYWKEGGEKVELYGNFHGNWKKGYPMEKNKQNNFFEYIMNLPKAVYEFKFKVDSEWKCSKYYPMKKDQRDILNNYIDLTNYSNISSKEEKKENHNSLDSDYYDCILPKKTEFTEVPSLPDCYKVSFQLDDQSIQENFGKKTNIKNCRRGSLCEKNYYKEILPPSRDKLSHMCSEINKESSCIKITTTQKLRNKFVTLVFYDN